MVSPLVSIVIPIYNTEKFVREAIESVLKQNFEEFELILVNDGSQDGSGDIAKEFLGKDPRVKYIEQENAGVSLARNRGLALAQGKFIFFMDSDDTISPDFIHSSLAIASSANSDLVVLGSYYCDRFNHVRVLPTCACFWRMDFLRNYPSIRFPEGIQPGEDGLFSHQLILLAERISFNPAVEYNYRSHENQNHRHSKEKNWDMLNSIPICLEIVKNFYGDFDLLKSKSLELALYIEHEPFEFRFLAADLDEEQQVFLHRIIKTFYDAEVAPNLNDSDKKCLSEPFLRFLEVDDPREFTEWYSKYKIAHEKSIRRKLFWNKFNFNTQARRENRARILKGGRK